MRATSSALEDFLATVQEQGDGQLLMADCYTLTLRTGTVLVYTNVDVPIVLNGVTYLANSVLIDGLRYKCSTGLDVDQQKITISPTATDTIGGVPFLVAVGNGILDGCQIQRDRAFMEAWGLPPIGSVTLFCGRVATVDHIGRTTCEVTVSSDLVLLDLDMPRNLYQPTCVHTLYGFGCGLSKPAYSATGTVGAGATATIIPWSGASNLFAQGTIAFTSGPNTGATANIKSATTTALTLNYPLLAVPTAGDSFTAAQGCDHTRPTCDTKFSNLGNFRGYPYVPPPTSAY